MTGFSFPPFEGIEPIPVVALPCVNGFYQLRTRDALVSILTNPAYIGWFLFDGAIVSQTAHEAIVPRDDFEYAFSRLSSTKLDGTPNESKPVVYRTHNRTKALLDDLVYSGTHKAYAMKSIQSYTTVSVVNGVRETAIAVKIATLDTAITKGYA